MTTKTQIRTAYQAIVDANLKLCKDNTCIYCDNQGVHKDDCIMPVAVSYLSLLKKDRMDRLAEMIQKGFNVNVVTNANGHIIDCDLI